MLSEEESIAIQDLLGLEIEMTENLESGENSYRISSKDVIIPDSLKIISFSPKKVIFRLKPKN